MFGRNLSGFCKQAGPSVRIHKGLRPCCTEIMFYKVRVKAEIWLAEILPGKIQCALTYFYIILQCASSSIYSWSTEITPAYFSNSSRKSIFFTSPCMVSIQPFPFSHHMLFTNLTYSHSPPKRQRMLARKRHIEIPSNRLELLFLAQHWIVQ